MISALTAAVLWWNLVPSVGAVEVEHYSWDLAFGGQSVGQRDLTVKYRSDGVAEIGVLESWTELAVSLGKDEFTWTQRLSGVSRAGSASFASSGDEDGWLREVQAVKKLQGWTVSIAEADEARVYQLERQAFDLTSLDLVDPGQGDRLQGRSHLRVLTAETGEVLEGPLASKGPVQVPIDGKAVHGTAYLWTLPEGPVELVYGVDGHLLRYLMRVGPITVSATLTAAPQARSYAEDMAAPLIGSSVQESAL